MARVCQTIILRSNMNITKYAFDLKLGEKIWSEGQKYNFRYILFQKKIYYKCYKRCFDLK